MSTESPTKNRLHPTVRLVLSGLVTLFLLPQVAAAQPIPKLAMLEFKIEGKAITFDDAAALGATARSHLVQSGGGAFKLIAKEKVMEILEQAGVKAERCTSECEIQTARDVGADYVATGSISKVSSRVLVVLDIRRTRDGISVASKDAVMQGTERLVEQVNSLADGVAREFVASLGGKPRAVSAAEAAEPAAPPREAPAAPAEASYKTGGLKFEYFNMPPWNGAPPPLAGNDPSLTVLRADLVQSPQGRSPAKGISATFHSIRISGEVHIETTGTHQIQVDRCCDASIIVSATLGSNTITTGQTARAQYFYKAGWYPFSVIVHAGASGAHTWEFKWQRPGDSAMGEVAPTLMRSR